MILGMAIENTRVTVSLPSHLTALAKAEADNNLSAWVAAAVREKLMRSALEQLSAWQQGVEFNDASAVAKFIAWHRENKTALGLGKKSEAVKTRQGDVWAFKAILRAGGKTSEGEREQVPHRFAVVGTMGGKGLGVHRILIVCLDRTDSAPRTVLSPRVTLPGEGGPRTEVALAHQIEMVDVADMAYALEMNGLTYVGALSSADQQKLAGAVRLSLDLDAVAEPEPVKRNMSDTALYSDEPPLDRVERGAKHATSGRDSQEVPEEK